MKLIAKFQDEDFRLNEVADVAMATLPDGRIVARAKAKSGGEHSFYYDSIKTFANDWEDYEEPKVYYYISDFGAIRECEIGKFPEDEGDRKRIGNYFETKEEAEKAVEKLEAWKRLKDKGFRFIPEFHRIEEGDDGRGNIMFIACTMNDDKDFIYGDNEDLKLLFGGEK